MSSLDARSLFAAAREDGPDATARDEVFRKIALTTGAIAGTAVGVTALSALPAPPALGAAAIAAQAATSAGAATSSAAATGGAFGLKLVALGAALGAIATALAVALAVTLTTPNAAEATARSVAIATPATAANGAKLAQSEPRKRDSDDARGREASANANANASASAGANANANAGAGAGANANANAGGATDGARGGGGAGDLAEEARLVTAARTALMAGDPARALTLVQNTRKLGTRFLEPEELGLEARALRALGRADDAAVTELLLRRRYPDHALAK